MKTLLILVVLLITFVNFTRAASEEEDNENDIFSTFDKIQSPTPYIKEFIEKTDGQYNISNQFNNTCPKITNEVINTLISTLQCFNDTDPNLTMCTAFRTRFITCTTPLINAIDRCLSEKTKGTPLLLANAFVSLINHFCTSSGEQIFEHINPCILPTRKNREAAETLLNKTDVIARSYEISEDEVSVQDICSLAHDVEKLWSEYVNKSCTNQFTRDVFIGLYHAAKIPCIGIKKNKQIVSKN